MEQNRYKIFTEVAPYYQDLLDTLSTARETISMMYLIYDAGIWADQLNEILIAKSKEGIQVRIMVDLFGTICDHPTQILKNFRMLRMLQENQIEINLFQPCGPRMSFCDRLHIKLCAIDQRTIYIGGSNIGDYYTSWQDTNLKIDGQLGQAGHQLYEYVAAHSVQGKEKYQYILQEVNLSRFWFGNAQVLLTVPGARKDIFRNLVELVLNTEKTVYFRYWYFMPNQEFLAAMLSQIERGVNVRVLLSDSTRVPIIDIANRIPIKKLVKAGAHIFRYQRRYMHSKIAWNEKGNIIFGSANMEEKGLNSNFEMCVKINDSQLVNEMIHNFSKDCAESTQQTPVLVKRQPLFLKILAHVLVLAAPIL
jgi:cardiolipin synthase